MTVANQEQAEHWNSGDESGHWVTYQDRYDRQLEPFAKLLLDAAGLTSGDSARCWLRLWRYYSCGGAASGSWERCRGRSLSADAGSCTRRCSVDGAPEHHLHRG
jgi:hypothetical protein